jgi:hypothetical protein
MTTTLEWQTVENGLRADAGPHGVYTIELWHADKEPGQCILKHSSERHVWNGGGSIHKTIELAKEFAQNIVTDAENPTPRRKGGYTLEDFKPFIHFRDDGPYDTATVRLAPLPNVEEQDIARGVNSIASMGHMLTPKWGYSKGEHGGMWTQFFLHVHDGSGYALIYGGQGGRIVRFAICRHQKKTGAGANHSRGWHPGHCIKCGLDMSVDSGD